MYRNVLIATDGSPQAGNAVSQAIEFAHTFDATLHALFVIDSKLVRTDATREPFKQTGERTLNEIEVEAAESTYQWRACRKVSTSLLPD